MYRLVLVERRYCRIQKRSALGAKVPLSMSKTTRVTSYQDNHAEVCLQCCGRTVELDTEKRALVLPWHAAKSDNDSKEMLKVDTSCVRSGHTLENCVGDALKLQTHSAESPTIAPTSSFNCRGCSQIQRPPTNPPPAA